MENLLIEERFKNIEYNLKIIDERISLAAEKSGRKREDIKFMAVTKTVEPMFINCAIDCGVDLIGENKVQELLSKKEYLKLDNVKSHLIGHLQTNKVKQIIPHVEMIQSLDSLKLAKEISKRSAELSMETKCLIEINIGEEDNKTGLMLSDLPELLEEISKMSNIKVEGLMSVPPFSAFGDELDKYFLKMHELFIDINKKKLDNINMSILSMGMSGDYEQAILCGSNLVRVGSAIFGPRIY